MPKGKGIMGILEDLDFIATSGGDETETVVSVPSQPPLTVASPLPSAGGTADSAMVEKIRIAVTSGTHSPRFARFLEALAKAKQAFPNDSKSAVTAAIAFSALTAPELREEISRSVAAAFMEAETSIKTDIAGQRDAQARALDSDTSRIAASIQDFEKQFAEIQQKLMEARNAQAQLSTRRATGDTEINQREATAMASLAVVRAEIESIKSLLP